MKRGRLPDAAFRLLLKCYRIRFGKASFLTLTPSACKSDQSGVQLDGIYLSSCSISLGRTSQSGSTFHRLACGSVHRRHEWSDTYHVGPLRFTPPTDDTSKSRSAALPKLTFDSVEDANKLLMVSQRHAGAAGAVDLALFAPQSF